LCNRPAQGVGLDVVGETAPPVDLHDREPLAVLGLEGRVAGDVDLAEVEAELALQVADHAAGALTQVAARSVVDDDLRYG
jgi:hypothetical protein